MKLITSVLIVVFTLQVIFADDLPSEFKKCSMKDTACLKDAINDAIPKMASGLKSLGVPSLDPLHMEKITIASGKIVQLTQNYDKIDVLGLSSGKITEASIDVDKGKVLVKCDFPKLELKGSYSVKGKILVLDVYGKGDFLISLDNVKGVLETDIEKYEKNGETHIKLTKERISITPELVHFQFDNLFDGNKQLGDNINLVLNDNWKEIYDELSSGYFDVTAADVKKLANKLFEKVPLKNIFKS